MWESWNKFIVIAVLQYNWCCSWWFMISQTINFRIIYFIFLRPQSFIFWYPVVLWKEELLGKEQCCILIKNWTFSQNKLLPILIVSLAALMSRSSHPNRKIERIHSIRWFVDLFITSVLKESRYSILVFVSYFIKINKMSALLCYEKLEADKKTGWPLPQMVSCDFRSLWYLILDDEHEVSRKWRFSGERDLPTCLTIRQKTIYIKPTNYSRFWRRFYFSTHNKKCVLYYMDTTMWFYPAYCRLAVF